MGKRRFDPEMEKLNGNGSLHRKSDTKQPHWKRASSMEDFRDSRQTNTRDVFLLCPDNSCRPPELLLVGDDEAQEPSDSHFLEIASPTTFRALATKAAHADDKVNCRKNFASPTGVVLEQQQSQVHFWQRSLAWSDDDEGGESSDSDTSKEDIWNRLSVPQMLGSREFAKHADVQKIPSKTRRRVRRPRRTTRISQQHHRSASLDIFREPDPVEHTAEIFWEEQVFSPDDLEKLAKLTIGGK